MEKLQCKYREDQFSGDYVSKILMASFSGRLNRTLLQIQKLPKSLLLQVLNTVLSSSHAWLGALMNEYMGIGKNAWANTQICE